MSRGLENAKCYRLRTDTCQPDLQSGAPEQDQCHQDGGQGSRKRGTAGAKAALGESEDRQPASFN